MTSFYQHLIVEIRDHVMEIRLNRPHLLNALNDSMLKELGLFAIYGWMGSCLISSESARFVQNLVDWALGIIRCIVQNVVESAA